MGEGVVGVTNRIEVGEVGRTLFVGLVVVPDPWMWERGGDFGGVVGMEIRVEGGFGMESDGRIPVVGVEARMCTSIGSVLGRGV
jgi:hypothetical protein